MDFSYINQDLGYKAMPVNQFINGKFPYKRDIEPRLVRFIREFYLFKLLDKRPSFPLEMKYWIRYDDVPCIRAYLKKLNTKHFV